MEISEIVTASTYGAISLRVASAMVDKQTEEQGDKGHVMMPCKDRKVLIFEESNGYLMIFKGDK